MRCRFSKRMVHGMKGGKCNKGFPKAFNEITVRNDNGYPLYRRRVGEQALVRGILMVNRNVVPYCLHLSLKYKAHINVEIKTSLLAVKYIYTYIFKGFDCANVAITSGGEANLQYNEITNVIDCRYVSAPEAMWRLRESKMHDRSHCVVRLPVHLPNRQQVYFEAGNEKEALVTAQNGRTKLESWFQLNIEDPEARLLFYTDITLNYVYLRNKYQKKAT